MDELEQLELMYNICDEQMVITQCSLLAVDASCKYYNSIATEHFLIATNDIDKKIVIEDFKEKMNGALNKIKTLALRIRDTIVDYLHKIVKFIKKAISTVYAKLMNKLTASTITKHNNWSSAVASIDVKVPRCFLSNNSIINTYDAAYHTTLHKFAKSLSEMRNNFDDPAKDIVNVKLSAVFPKYNNALDYIKTECGKELDFFDKIDKENKQEYSKLLHDIDSSDALGSAVLAGYRAESRLGIEISRKASSIILKKLRFAASSLIKVARYDKNENQSSSNNKELAVR